jgi:hypothetical protein
LFPGSRRPLCVRGHRILGSKNPRTGAQKSTDEMVGAVTPTVPPASCPLTCHFTVPVHLAVALVSGVGLGVVSAEGVVDPPVGRVGLPVNAVRWIVSKTAMPCPARRAASVAGTPELSHSDTAACRRLGRRRIGLVAPLHGRYTASRAERSGQPALKSRSVLCGLRAGRGLHSASRPLPRRGEYSPGLAGMGGWRPGAARLGSDDVRLLCRGRKPRVLDQMTARRQRAWFGRGGAGRALPRRAAPCCAS